MVKQGCQYFKKWFNVLDMTLFLVFCLYFVLRFSEPSKEILPKGFMIDIPNPPEGYVKSTYTSAFVWITKYNN